MADLCSPHTHYTHTTKPPFIILPQQPDPPTATPSTSASPSDPIDDDEPPADPSSQDVLTGLITLTSAAEPAPNDLASSSATPQDTPKPSGPGHEVLAALSRAGATFLAVMFQRPIRLFRPVKISTWAGLQAVAEEQGKAVSAGFVRGLMRQEGWKFFPRHVLPPLVVNATVGFILFFSYAWTSSHLTPLFDSNFYTSTLLIPFLSGGVAGASQSIISTPLDNARILLLRRQRLLAQARAPASSGKAAARARARLHMAANGSVPFTGWLHLLRDAVFKPGAAGLVNPATLAAGTAGESQLSRARAMARNGYTAMGLVAVKDGVAFGAFFLVFSVGRRLARSVGLTYDGLAETADDVPGEDERRRRTPAGIILQSFLILASGGVAGWVFSLVARPFDRVRGAIVEGQERWARETAARAARAAKEERAGRPAEGKELWERRRRVQIKRKRAVGRTFNIRKRRAARAKAKVRRDHALATAHQVAPAQPPSFAIPSTNPSSPPPIPAPPATPPSELELVRQAAHRYGAFNFLFASTPSLQRQSRLTLLSRKPLSEASSPIPQAAAAPAGPEPVPRRVGPTRRSARGHLAKVALEQSRSGWARSGMKVLSFVPPYAVGFFVFSLLNGDLGT